MREILFLLLIGVLFSFTNVDRNEVNQRVVARYTYTSKKCSYDVFRVNAGGTINCGDWTYIGRITPSKGITITLNGGDNVIIRILHRDADVCNGSKLKAEYNLYVNPSNNQSYDNNEELHDWDCK